MTSTKLKTAILGFPRIGEKRELKFALEAFWNRKISEQGLLQVAASIKKRHWQLQKDHKIDVIPSNDFSLYDHVLDTAFMLGAIPEQYVKECGGVNLETYFSMARGRNQHQTQSGDTHGQALKALEMTKWFDTNYHYIVPEIAKHQQFKLQPAKVIEDFIEAKAMGILTRPVILGPVTFLSLAKCRGEEFELLSVLPKLIPLYQDLFKQLHALGCQWVQIDEPILVTDLDANRKSAFGFTYKQLADRSLYPKMMLASYFGNIGDNLSTLLSLPVDGIHIDLTRGKGVLETLLSHIKPDQVLSLGIIDGRNIWRSDLSGMVQLIKPVIEKIGAARIEIAPSCSLLHVPIDLEKESEIDNEIKPWLAFAVQKLEELNVLNQVFSDESPQSNQKLAENCKILKSRKSSKKIFNAKVQSEMALLAGKVPHRLSPFHERYKAQKKKLQLPPFPTTTIGSFPQSADVRKARADYLHHNIDEKFYDNFIAEKIRQAILWQEEVGLDVFVHGEFERNDMVQYFAEQLDGIAFTVHGWVQSYGSRCVRPPIIYGDVSRPAPMTVKWWQIAQSFTNKIVKAMLTGPVTILNWSFVRDDQPRSLTCEQIALAIRAEVDDLEQAGAKIIQIDEAALREGLPLRKHERADYLEWAVRCFQICESGVRDETQIHTHMCYSEFNDIIEAIAAMDADVISIEASRSHMEILDVFKTFKYPNQIGPGVYDIHSPRVPETSEILELLGKALEHLDAKQLWVNPDCGLKTRHWEEVRPAIANMVEAARILRKNIML